MERSTWVPRRLWLAIIAALLTSWLPPVTHVSAAVLLSPTSGPRETSVSVSGSLPLTGFSASVVCRSSSFTIVWGEQWPYQTLAQGTAELQQSGYSFSATFSVPSDATLGPHTITVSLDPVAGAPSCAASQTATFTVTAGGSVPTVVATPNTSGSNQAPACGIKSPASMTADDSLTLYSTSWDPDGSIASWAWTVSGPHYLPPGNGSSLGFAPTRPGTYQINLVVTDERGAYAGCSVTMAVAPSTSNPSSGSSDRGPASGNPALGCNFTVPATMTLGERATLSASQNAVPGASTFNWSITGPSFSDSSGGLNYNFGPPAAGTYQISLTLSDNAGASSSCSKSLTVTSPLSNQNAGTSPGAAVLTIDFSPPTAAPGASITILAQPTDPSYNTIRFTPDCGEMTPVQVTDSLELSSTWTTTRCSAGPHSVRVEAKKSEDTWFQQISTSANYTLTAQGAQ